MLQQILAGEPVLAWSVFIGLGLVVGSFLNVVIHRLPLMMMKAWRAEATQVLADDTPLPEGEFDLMRPRSRCPACGHLIGALQNVPLLSWALMRGRCRHCGSPISARYPVVEAGGAVVAALALSAFGPGWQALAACLFGWALIALAVIDLDTQLLPDDITLPLLWLGLLVNVAGMFVSLDDAVVGAAAGYGVLWGIFHLFRLVTGKEGMGYGDFKLLAAIGAWLGWQALPVVILLSSLVGAVVGIALILFRGHDRQIPIPFGPYLAAAGLLAMYAGETITSQYLRLF